MASSDVVLNVVTKTEQALKQVSDFSKQSVTLLKGVEKQLSFLNQSATTFVGNLGAGLALKGFDAVVGGIQAVADAIVNDGISAAIQYEDSLNSLKSSFELTGIASKESVSDFEAFANELETTTKFTDDAILTNAALIQSLSNLTNEGLKEATIAATDLAAATGRDLATASELVAKAANGNVTALNKLGVEIKKGATDAQTYANALQALNERFGGAANRQLQTFSGSTTQLKNAFEDTIKAVGNLVVKSPALVGAIGGIAKVFQSLTGFLEKSFQGQDPLRPLVNGAISVGQAVNDFVIRPFLLFADIGNVIFKALQTGFQTIIASLGVVGEAIGRTLGAVGLVSDETKQQLIDFAASSNQVFVNLANETQNSFSQIGSSTVLADGIDEQLNNIQESVNATTKIIPEQFKNAAQASKNALADLSDATIKIGIQIGDEGAIEAQRLKVTETFNAVGQQLALSDTEQKALALQRETEFQNAILDAQVQAQIARSSINAEDKLSQLQLERDIIAQRLALVQGNVEAETAIRKRQALVDRQISQQRLQFAGEFFGNLASLTQTGNKDLFAIGKAAALAEATVSGALAVQKALAAAPPPINFALAAAVGVRTAVQIAQISAQSLAAGTSFVRGGTPGVDSVPALLMPGERVVSTDTNRDLTAFLEKPSNETSEETNSILSAIFDRLGALENQIVVNIGNREIVNEVREGLRSGRALA